MILWAFLANLLTFALAGAFTVTVALHCDRERGVNAWQATAIALGTLLAGGHLATVWLLWELRP